MILAKIDFDIEIEEFTKDVLEKYELWRERKIIMKYYFLNGESLNRVIHRLNCSYVYCCNLFKIFGLERRPDDYDPTLRL